MDDKMMSTSGLQLCAVLSSVVVERVGDFSIATDRNAAARQSASIILCFHSSIKVACSCKVA